MVGFIPARKNFLGELLVFWMCRSSLHRAFHSVNFRAIAPLPAPPTSLQTPIIFYSNHSSWWDGYLAHIVVRQVYNLEPYLMMDVRQLRRYPFFSWAGCFSVNQQDGRSALRSIEYSVRELKEGPGRALWIFPQGEILPQERRPLAFHSGLAHLIKRLGACYVYPVAFRFEFLAEQYPDIFIDVGEAISFEASAKIEVKTLTAQLEDKLTSQLTQLRDQISLQERTDFIKIIEGKTSNNIFITLFSNLIKNIQKKG